MSTPAIGDIVQVGKGKTLWKVTGFGEYANGQLYAALDAMDGYTNSSATLDRLTIIEAA